MFWINRQPQIKCSTKLLFLKEYMNELKQTLFFNLVNIVNKISKLISNITLYRIFAVVDA